MKKQLKKTQTTSSYKYYDLPISPRGYLLNEAQYRVSNIFNWEGEFYPLISIASVLYLYGAEFEGIHSFNFDESLDDKSNKSFLKIYKVPKISFRLKNMPLIFKDKEYEIKSKKLIEFGYNFWYPYKWITKEGDEIREVIKSEISKNKKTKAIQKWEKDSIAFASLVSKWYKSFLKTYKNRYDFELQIYDMSNCNYLLTIKDDKYEGFKTKEKIKKRQKEYTDMLLAFSEYIHDGFLNNKSIFPKTIYEK